MATPSFCRNCHGSAKWLGKVFWLHLLLLVGVPAAVEKTEEAEQKQTGTVFPSCAARGKGCLPRPERSDFVCFGCTEFKLVIRYSVSKRVQKVHRTKTHQKDVFCTRLSVAPHLFPLVNRQLLFILGFFSCCFALLFLTYVA